MSNEPRKPALRMRPRKPSGSLAKGASFERSVCKALSLWVSEGRHEDWFWLSAMSGGRSTVGRKMGKHLANHAGDISATAADALPLTRLFYIECKNVKNLDLGSWIFRGTGKGIAFWMKTCREAEHYGKFPMLIAKENVTPTLWCFRPSFLVSQSNVVKLQSCPVDILQLQPSS